MSKPDRSSQMSSLATLAFTAWTFPFVVSYIATARLWRRLTGGAPSPQNATKKTAIVTGGKMTKALCVARYLKKAGCRVVLVETHKYSMVATSFASCVDRFVTVPVPEQKPAEYLSALKVLAYEENADVFVPVSSPVSSVYDARVGSVLPAGCRSLSCGEAWTAMLDDKVNFSELARLAGLPTPDTRRMTSIAEIAAFNDELLSQGEHATRYVLKSIAYDSMRRLDLFTLPAAPKALAEYTKDIDVSAGNPWLVQAFVSGTEYSTCALAHDGALSFFTDNVASISCFNYKHAGEAKLRHWVETFCRTHKLSGVVCIDFFIDEAGTPLAIECNPRFSSNITSFYNHPNIGKALLEPEKCVADGIVETPLPTHEETCWMGCELFYALTKPTSLMQKAIEVRDAILYKKDAYYDPDDVWPFLALYYWHIPTLLVRNIMKGNRWAKIDLCIGKLTEVNGD